MLDEFYTVYAWLNYQDNRYSTFLYPEISNFANLVEKIKDEKFLEDISKKMPERKLFYIILNN